ncbi:MAG TPA: TolC family protein [Elusimicrobiota bacterium]|nr:TolC family protein [Elusimicrobiota bacterium]
MNTLRRRILLAGVLIAGPVLCRAGDSVLKSSEWTLRSSSGTPVKVEALVRTALQRNFGYRSAELDLAVARADRGAAAGEFDPALSADFNGESRQSRLVTTPGLLPSPATVNRDWTANVALSKQFTFGTGLTLGARSTLTEITPQSPGYTSDVYAAVSQPLLEGLAFGSAATAARRADLGQMAAEADARRAMEATIATVETAYWTLREKEHLEQVSRDSLNTAQEMYDRNKKMNALKLMSDFDVLTAESGVAAREVSALDAEQARKDAMEALVFQVYGEEALPELRRNGLSIVTTSDELQTPQNLDEDKLMEEALSTRLDRKAAQYRLKQAEASRRSARNMILPNLDLAGSAGGTGSRQTGGKEDLDDSLGDAADRKSKFWTLGLTFKQSIGNRTDRNRYRAAVSARDQSRLALLTVENQIRQDVRTAVRAVRYSLERLEKAARSRDLAQRQLNGEKKRLQLGLVDSFRVLQSEDNLSQAQRTYESARATLRRDITAYELAIGAIAKRYGQ